MEIRGCFPLLVLIIITSMHSQLKVLADHDVFYKVDGTEDLFDELDGTEKLVPIYAQDAPAGYCKKPVGHSNGRMQCGKLASNTKKYVCIGGCVTEFEFPNKKTEGKITCDLTSNQWTPRSEFPDCVKKITCDPPCANGGSCVKENVCSCLDGFQGQLCKQMVCTPPCQNKGKCGEKNTCSCPPRFEGNRCETDICKAPPKPRNAKLTCSKLLDFKKFMCIATCEDGYVFANGEIKLNHTCDSTVKRWTPRYEFPNCEAECNPPCQNRGSCEKGNTCSCTEAFEGYRCENAKPSQDECEGGWTEYFNTDNPNRSEIGDDESLDRIKKRYPVCTGGFIKDVECKTIMNRMLVNYSEVDALGLKCSKDVGFICIEHIRQKKCEDFVVRFLCECAVSVAVCNPRCQNGGSCVDGYQCVCPPGFDGQRCEKAVCNPPCKNGGSCADGNICACAPGFDGDTCEDDICRMPPHPRNGKMRCSSTLINGRNRFACEAECEEGYQFPNGENKARHTCDLRAKAWIPRYAFPDCEGIPEPGRPPTVMPLHMCPEVPPHILKQCPSSCPQGHACFEFACVPRENCPCFRNTTNLAPTRSTWTNEKCENCTCRTGGISKCEPMKCPRCLQGEISFIDSKCLCRCINCPENTVFCKETGYCIEKELLCNGAAQCKGIQITCPTEPPLTELPPSINPMNCSTDQQSETDTCEILGSMLKTFDGSSYQYEACNHILMKELMFELFSVTVRKICSPESPVSCYRHLIIEVDGLVITLGPGTDSVTVKNTRIPVRSISLVSKKFPGIELERIGNTLVFRSLKYNFKVTWDKMENSKIKVSECLLHSIAGLCGFYDRSLEGDLKMPNRLVAHSDQEFGDSWAIGSVEKCSQPNYTPEISTNASAACEKLRDEPFQSCYGQADLNRKVQACVMLMSECLQRSVKAGIKSLDESEYEKCKCHAYESFTEDCEIYKTRPSEEWRILHDCVSTCPHGMEWQDCGPGCELTCDNYRQRSEICTSNCVPGCYCPSGLVRHQNQCVNPNKCQDCICRGHGDPNYITFDGRYYAFQGTCSYILAQHTTSKDKTVNFQVIGNNVECSEEPKTSCMEGLKIYWNGHVVEKYKYLPAVLDGREMQLSEFPYDKGGISIAYVQNKYTLVHIKKINLVVRYFDQMHGFTIELPSLHYYNKTEGLCGVCNFIESDDFYHRGGFVTKDTEDFAYSWLVDGQRRKSCEFERVDVVEPPPGICNFTATPCDTILDPSPFLKSCQNDVRYSRSLKNSVCRSKFQYAQQCCERGVPLDEWLKFSGCVSSCPAGMVYKCTSACPKTCENYKTYREDDCPVMPQSTCVCPDGEVMKLGKCVKTIACEVCDEEGHAVGDVWQVGLCKTCECLPNLSTKCTVHECPEPPVCTERETLQKITGRIATCCGSYKCVPKVRNCEFPEPEICPTGRSLVLKHSNNCPVYRCECLPQLCPPSVTPFLDDGESLRLVKTDCCPEVRLSCNPNSCRPPPNCTQGFKLSTERARCCFKHKCVPEDNVCIYQHQYDVVNGIEVKLPLEKYYDNDYQPGSTWHDGLCRECTCVNIKGRMLSRCRLELCQHPADFPDSERYIREEVRVPGSCCPKYWRKLCVDQGVKYRIGQEWRSPSRHHLCNNISRCVSDNAGEAVIEVATECEKPCER